MDFDKVIIDKACNAYILELETFKGYFFEQKTFKMIKHKVWTWQINLSTVNWKFFMVLLKKN
jgi:hypothetical protein